VAQCKNNLKQIGLAWQSHHDTFKVMPSGGGDWSTSARVMVHGVPADYNSQSWGWMYQILPFIEQNNLWANKSDFEIAETPVFMYICPSFRGPIIRPYSQNGDTVTTQHAMNDYIANCGTALASYDGALVPSKTGYSAVQGLVRRIGDITDGTSSTLLVAEKFVDPAKAWNASDTSDCGDDQGWVDGWDNDAVGCLEGGGLSTVTNQDGLSVQLPQQIDPKRGDIDSCGF
jgi:hypothetical protein